MHVVSSEIKPGLLSVAFCCVLKVDLSHILQDTKGNQTVQLKHKGFLSIQCQAITGTAEKLSSVNTSRKIFTWNSIKWCIFRGMLFGIYCLQCQCLVVSKNDGLNFTERIWGKTQHSCVARLFSKIIGEVGSFYHYVDCLLRLLKWQTFKGNLCHIRKLWYRNYFCCEGIHRVWPKGLPIKNKANLRDLIAATGLVILLKFDPNHQFFVPCDLEIWWMALENNRAPLLYYIKLCASFQIHRWIQIGITVRKH